MLTKSVWQQLKHTPFVFWGSYILGLARPLNAVHPLVALLVGYLVAEGSNFLQLMVALAGLFILHSITTIWNDIEDWQGDTYGKRAPIEQVRLQPSYRYWPVFLAVSSLGLIAALFFVNSLLALLFCLLFGLGVVYNTAPIRASHRPLPSVVVLFLAYGFIPFLIGVSLGHFSWLAVILGLFWGLTRVSLSLLKDYKDAPADAKFNKRTFLLVHGTRSVARLSLLSLVVGIFGTLSTLYLFKPQFSIVMLGMIAAWLVYERTTLLGLKSYTALNRTFKESTQYQLIFDLGVVVWLSI